MKAYRDSNQEIIRERKKKYSKTERAKELNRIRNKIYHSNNKDLIQTIMMNWSMLVPDGVPDLKNKKHLVYLEESLRQMGMSEEFVERLYENITS